MRSTNSNSKFEDVVFVPSKAINGNSNTSLSYGFDDATANNTITYYKLKQVDLDGRFYYSNTVVLKNTNFNQVEMVGLYPNPSAKEINLLMNAASYSNAVITITDVYGKTVLQQAVELSMGNNIKKISIGHLAVGMYTLKINDGHLYKFVKL